MAQPIIFEDIFDIKDLNPGGKKFDRVNRLHAVGNTYDVDVVVDVNSELFPSKQGDRITIAFASTLSLQGIPDDGSYNPNMGPSLMDQYDYVMHGRVFKIVHAEGQNIEISTSFGGLLLKVTGDQARLSALHMDMQFFLLMRNTAVKKQ